MPNRRQFMAGMTTLAATAPFPAAAADTPSDRPEVRALQSGHIGQYQGGVYLLPATDETVQWGWFDNAEPPRARIKSGDTIVMETMMASMNRILPGVDIDTITKLRVDHPGRGPHTITGPVYVEGAMPGDTLKIRLDRIVPKTYGANWNLPGALKLGQFPDVFGDPQVKHFFLDLQRGVAEFAPGIEIPVRPFPGIVGVARAESGRHSTVPPGPFGGNLDIREMVQGTTLYLPVFVDGALLWSGDSHAAQGNGEINLTAIETAFNELRMHVEVLKGKTLAWPRVETPTHWLTLGYDRDLEKALTLLEEETLRFLVDERGMKTAEAKRTMAEFGDSRVAEVVNQVKGLYCMLPKKPRTKPDSRPVKETRSHFVTHAVADNLMTAMNEAAMKMIETVAQRKSLAPIDAYALASLAMDTRIGHVAPGERHIHCLVPKSLWTRPA